MTISHRVQRDMGRYVHTYIRQVLKSRAHKRHRDMLERLFVKVVCVFKCPGEGTARVSKVLAEACSGSRSEEKKEPMKDGGEWCSAFFDAFFDGLVKAASEAAEEEGDAEGLLLMDKYSTKSHVHSLEAGNRSASAFAKFDPLPVYFFEALLLLLAPVPQNLIFARIYRISVAPWCCSRRESLYSQSQVAARRRKDTPESPSPQESSGKR